MNTTTLELLPASMPASSVPSPAAAPLPRADLYTTIHKALRHFMADTLIRIGSMDTGDAEEVDDALEQLGGLLATLRGHVSHENEFVHAAIDQRRPGASQRLGQDHDDHLATIAALEAEARALPNAGDRDGAALRLYRHLALFVAENFEHMQVEETSNNAQLWALFTDAELTSLHDRLIASVPMPAMAVVLRWMAGALNLKELAGLLGAMKFAMPPEAMRGVLDLMRPRMSTMRWGRLAGLLGLPQVPGLVAFA